MKALLSGFLSLFVSTTCPAQVYVNGVAIDTVNTPFCQLICTNAGIMTKASGKERDDYDAASSPESKLIGKPIAQAPKLVKRASPATYISKADPPFFVEHGTNDPLVPTQQSINFAAELSTVLGKDKVTYIPVEGVNHGGPPFETPENLEKVFKNKTYRK